MFGFVLTRRYRKKWVCFLVQFQLEFAGMVLRVERVPPGLRNRYGEEAIGVFGKAQGVEGARGVQYLPRVKELLITGEQENCVHCARLKRFLCGFLQRKERNVDLWIGARLQCQVIRA